MVLFMEERRIFLLGNSLLTSSIAGILEADPRFVVLGSAATPEEALPLMNGHCIDAIIVLGTDDQTTFRMCPVLAQYPGLPILRVDISKNQVQLITSQNLAAKPTEFMAALSTLPRRTL